jgi:hypothetical protein
MRRGVVVIGLSLCAIGMAPSSAYTAEGSTSRLHSDQPLESRVSRYVEGSARSETSETKAQLGKAHESAKVSSKSIQKKLRAAAVNKSARAEYFYFYDAASVLITDRDEDGYFSEFRIRFDADSNVGDALVYAQLYLRRLGTPDWQLYHTTDEFWIEGQSNSDDYFVTATLDQGFARAEYQALVDLYEVGYSDIVATIGPYDSAQLSYLPLEEAELDIPIELPGFDIDGVTTTLLIDEDSDGHYSQFRIRFDPDANVDGNLVYAKVWLRAEGDTWIEEHTSEDFIVDASGQNDVYSLTADWISGYPTSYYDVQIDLYESASGLLVASAGSERSELAQIPLEDQTRDVRPNPPSMENGGSSSSSGSGGGGSMGLMCILVLLSLAIRRIGK